MSTEVVNALDQSLSSRPERIGTYPYHSLLNPCAQNRQLVSRGLALVIVIEQFPAQPVDSALLTANSNHRTRADKDTQRDALLQKFHWQD
jgi:hypothetical protein